MHIIRIGEACPCCGRAMLDLHTLAEQSDEHKAATGWDWLCDDGDKVVCGCGANLQIELDAEGYAAVRVNAYGSSSAPPADP